VLARLKKETTATLVFASTTPIDDERHARRKGGYDRSENDVKRYNDVALRLMRKNGVVVHDLHGLVKHVGASKLLAGDGTHYTKEGRQRQAEAVADCVLRHLAVRNAKPPGKFVPDPQATKRYKQEEARRDALVPDVFKKLPVGNFAVPRSADEWKKRRPALRKVVEQSLGKLPSRPRPSARLIAREVHPHFVLESLTIPNGVDGDMTAYFFVPHGRKEKAPAVMWLHSSSDESTSA
jgi:hypothetical protein